LSASARTSGRHGASLVGFQRPASGPTPTSRRPGLAARLAGFRTSPDDFVLAPEAVVEGRILDDDGNPVRARSRVLPECRRTWRSPMNPALFDWSASRPDGIRSPAAGKAGRCRSKKRPRPSSRPRASSAGCTAEHESLLRASSRGTRAAGGIWVSASGVDSTPGASTHFLQHPRSSFHRERDPPRPRRSRPRSPWRATTAADGPVPDPELRRRLLCTASAQPRSRQRGLLEAR
jgi:hypothetical protein